PAPTEIYTLSLHDALPIFLRRDIGADLDPNIRALDLDLADQPAPVGELPSVDIATALSRALANRPEVEAIREQLASDGLTVRLRSEEHTSELQSQSNLVCR